ncbi:MAG TPA: hypothetical protein VNG32_00440 [Candidatus Dormibacteraeota bacterium]|nr:hypothetical protein [Candidatus Dormibacteraeota bacterium]
MTNYIFKDKVRYVNSEVGLLLIGNYTLKERNDFINKVALTYMAAHPKVPVSVARRQARLRWRRKVLREFK